MNKKFEDIQKNLEEIKEKNEKLEKPNDLKDTKEKEESIEKEQKESKENIQKKQNKKAAPHQKKAADEMKEMSEKMNEEMTEMEKEKQEEDYDALRQILENLVTVSKDQEKLMKEFHSIKKLQSASQEEIIKVIGESKAEIIIDYFKLIYFNFYLLKKNNNKLKTEYFWNDI